MDDSTRPRDMRILSSPTSHHEEGGDHSPPGDQRFGDRYRLTEVIGSGAFGVVWRAFDEQLNCGSVVKLIPLTTPAEEAYAADLMKSKAVETHLAHPHIEPLRARGIVDKTLWLAMDFIDGGTFVDLIAELYPGRNRRPEPTVAPRGEATVRPAVELDADGQPVTESLLAATDEVIKLLIQAARGLGAAHQSRVVHRDLKPDNLMFAWEKMGGDRRRRVARVIDWGLALELPPGEEPVAPVPDGIVIGVAAYLAPERLDCRDAGSPRSDVYSLGAILHHILTGDAPAPGGFVEGPAIAAVEARVPEWVEVCRRAMAYAPDERFEDGTAFAEALAAAAEEVRLRNNDAHRRRAETFRRRAREEKARAKAELSAFAEWDDSTSREAAWAREDDADGDLYAAGLAEARWLAGVQASLRRMPELPVGHVMLADHHAEALGETDLTGRAFDVRLHEERLRALSEDIRQARETCRERKIWLRPETEGRIDGALARYARLLTGDARLTLVTDPPGRRVEYAPIRVEKRRRMEGERWLVGVTPLHAVPIPHGAGMLYIEAEPGRCVVHSIRTHRTEHWDGIPPGEATSQSIPLPPVISIGVGEAYVPAGWAWIGGDPHALDAVARARVWVDGFVMKTNPVTFAEYATFIGALLADGSPEVDRHLPRPATPEGRLEKPSIGITLRDGTVVVEPEVAALPVCSVDAPSARAYARWYAEESGLPWRLPSQWEYEKAARGADGRRLPWGDHMEASWTRVINSTAETARPAPVDAPTLDVSVYGIRWLVGNRMTWCLDAWTPDGPADGSRIRIVEPAEADLIIGRGGAFCLPARTISAATRFSDPPSRRNHLLGIRLVRGIVAPA